MGDIALWALVALFWIYEIVAHFAFHNREAHTLSNRIWAFEQKFGWPARGAVTAGLLVLFLHLVLHLF